MARKPYKFTAPRTAAMEAVGLHRSALSHTMKRDPKFAALVEAAEMPVHEAVVHVGNLLGALKEAITQRDQLHEAVKDAAIVEPGALTQLLHELREAKPESTEGHGWAA